MDQDLDRVRSQRELRRVSLAGVSLMLSAMLALIACDGSGSGDVTDSSGSGTDSGPQNSGTGGSGLGTDGADSGGAASGSGGQSGGGASGGNGSGGSNTMIPSSGCEATEKPATGQYDLAVGDGMRSYYLLAASSAEPVPLVISFHGLGGTGQNQMGNFSPDQLGGAVVHMFPDGVSQGGSVGWADSSNDSPDVEFVRALINEAKAKHCIDESKIFAVGFSWGGGMAHRVGCALGSDIAGIVAVASEGPAGDCNGPVKVLIAHGTADVPAPPDLGMASLAKWKGHNGCDDTSSPSVLSGCVEFSGCDKPVLWCEHSGGHEVPAFLKPGYFNFLTDSL